MSRHTLALPVFLVLLAAVPAQAQAAPDKPWSKSDGDFVVTLEFASQSEPAPPGETVTTFRGTPIFASVVFSGCTRTAEGHCDVVARFTTRTPEGKPLGEPISLGSDKPLPGPKIVQLTGKLGIPIQPIESLGVYKVNVEVLDRVSKKQLVLERDFTAVELPTGTPR